MAIATLYIDSADEITSVIERIKSSHEPIVALVVPKGAILIQSIVNLKLARKATLDAEKDLILVTTDKIGRNLASQIGITVVTSEKEVSAAARGESTQDPPSEEAKVIAGVRIHRYYDQEPAPDQEIGPEVIVPKQLLSAKEAEPVAAPEPLKLERKQITSPPPLPSTALPAPHSPAAVDTNQPEPAVEVISTKSANTAPSPAKAKKRPKRLVIILGSLITVLLLVLVAVGVLIIPATKITLTLSSTPWSEESVILASLAQTAISLDGATIPAQKHTVTTEESVDFKATGTKQTGVAATGTATIYNTQDSTSQTIQAGAKLSGGGHSYTTTEAATVPGATLKAGVIVPGSVTVNLQADSIGPDSNLENLAANITYPAGTKLYATIIKTSGGSSQEHTVVSATDLANAKTALNAKLQDALKAKLLEQANGQGWRFVDNTDIFTLEDFKTDVALEAEVAGGKASGRGILDRLVLNYSTLTEAINQRVATKNSDRISNTVSSLELTKLLLKDPTTLEAGVKVTGKASPVFDSNPLVANLTGKSLEEARSYLKANSPATTIDISQNPEWWPLKRIPVLSSSLKIESRLE